MLYIKSYNIRLIAMYIHLSEGVSYYRSQYPVSALDHSLRTSLRIEPINKTFIFVMTEFPIL